MLQSHDPLYRIKHFLNARTLIIADFHIHSVYKRVVDSDRKQQSVVNTVTESSDYLIFKIVQEEGDG